MVPGAGWGDLHFHLHHRCCLRDGPERDGDSVLVGRSTATVVYVWLFLEKFLFPVTSFAQSTRWVLWICNLLFGWKIVSGFFKIRRNLH